MSDIQREIDALTALLEIIRRPDDQVRPVLSDADVQDLLNG